MNNKFYGSQLFPTGFISVVTAPQNYARPALPGCSGASVLRGAGDSFGAGVVCLDVLASCTKSWTPPGTRQKECECPSVSVSDYRLLRSDGRSSREQIWEAEIYGRIIIILMIRAKHQDHGGRTW